MDLSTNPTIPSNVHTAWRALSGDVAVGTIVLMVSNLTVAVGVWVSAIHGLLPLGGGCLISAVNAYAAFTVMHEASHGNVDGGNPRFAALEEAFGWIAGAFLLTPYPVFRVVHANHHAHANDPERDPDHWVVSKNPVSLLLRCLTLPFHYYYYVLFGPGAKLEAVRKVRRPLVFGLLGFAGIFGLLWILGFGQYALWLWVYPALISIVLLALAFDWLPHYPHMLRDRFHDTRILLMPSLTLPLLWQNYHLIHHLHPRVPFYRYGQCFREIRPLLEREGAAVEGFADGLTRPFKTDLRTALAAEGPLESRWQHRVRITEVTHETEDAVAICFEPVGGWSIEHEAGQYMTFEVHVEGEILHRCYSIYTPPGAPSPGICTKRIPDGRVSGWLKRNARPGVELVVRPPAGQFVYKPNENGHDIVLIGGGSGITPLRSIAEAALRQSDARVTLLYGNRDERSIIFREALDSLARQFEGRFTVRHVLTEASRAWTGGRGILDRATTQAELARLPGASAADAHYFICGPAPMMSEANAALVELGIEAKRIRQEHFVARDHDTQERPPVDLPMHPVSFLLDGETHTVEVSEGETVLDAAIRGNVPLRYSCRSGRCGTCMLKVKSGHLEQREDDDALLISERAAGLVLACCAKPRSTVVLETPKSW